MLKKKCIISIFVILILLPLLLKIVYDVSNIRMDAYLYGIEIINDSPEVNLNNLFNGNFQKDYDAWHSENFVLRGMYTKVYSQIQWSLYHLGNEIIGRDYSIFQQGYIDDILSNNENDFSLQENQKIIDDYIYHLNSLDNKLNNINKKLVVYTTPSKAEYQYNNIPYKYKIQRNNEGIRAIDYFRSVINKTNIAYLDSKDYVKSNDWPTFYKKGIHWSRPAEQTMDKAILDKVKDISKNNIRTLYLGNLNVSDTPYWRDSDVFDLQNIITKGPKEQYYEYNMYYENVYEKFDKMNILIQGDSFANSLFEDILKIWPNESVRKIFYSESMQYSNGQFIIFNRWEDLNLSELLDNADCIVIELNESKIKNCSDGFVEYLDNYLDSYVPSIPEKKYIEKVDVKNNLGNDKDVLCGFYDFESEFVWSNVSSDVNIKNDHIIENGLEAEIEIPEYLISDTYPELYVYINGNPVFSKEYKEVQRDKISLSYDEISQYIDDSGIINVAFYCTKGFVPKDLGISDDSRNLSFQVYYIGEGRKI